MISLEVAYSVRDELLKRLHDDLLGGESDVVLDEKPLSRFVVGVLYPAVDSSLTGSMPESVEEATEEEPGDAGAKGSSTELDEPAVALSRVRFPQSIGLTFAVNPSESSRISVSVSADHYLPSLSETGEELWTRHRIEWSEDYDVAASGTMKVQAWDGLEARTIVRRPTVDGSVSVTMVIVNTGTAPRGERDAYCWFNPRIEVRSAPGAFAPRRDSAVSAFEEEAQSDRLLYREIKTYAVGHGCAVEWSGEPQVHIITSTFLPRHELLLSNPAGAERDIDLSMIHLSAENSFDGLARLIDGYESWIDELGDSDGLDEHRAAVERHIADARSAVTRMRAGVRILRGDPQVRRAFQLMNMAMAEQRSRQEYHRAGQIGDPQELKGTWRSFQIAFILLNLEGVADPISEDRELADVLWFPTGGGKTEAYFGLIAIAILLRRLRTPDQGGVSVIMRYTLRLLTLQQYQRASGLICALEELRTRKMPRTRPISIGLWVGQATTPNTVKDAKQALSKLRSGTELGSDAADPVQLKQCPWCGTGLDATNYHIYENGMRIDCPNLSCTFRNGLPVHIVDEDVYSKRPSLVIATVDKFALMPWKREVGALFGTSEYSPAAKALPPDLIVQDELHLISGPLGTIVGLYETAFDAACSRPHRPKLVASTATVRRAPEQVRSVFAREARQFPPPGTSYRNSYFAVEASRANKGSREYVGVLSAGTSQSALMVRVYASLLQSASRIDGEDGREDLYWTLLGYFNSLRVLGGAFIQVIDDVPDQMKVIATRRGEECRTIRIPREMTSRKMSSEISDELKILEKRRSDQEAADVVLATNMISVGVDVDRLGLMVMMGQPQTSAEYIQATSRVGRRMPGLVVTLYNAARSRDLSHFEDFSAYHRMLYRHVEATSATPFAARARDRALHGVLVALARLLIPAAAPRRAAGNIDDWQEELEACVERILARVDDARGAETEPEMGETVRGELERLLDLWSTASDRLSHFDGWYDRTGALLVPAMNSKSEREDPDELAVADPPWQTLTSMREVDQESKLYLIFKKKTARKQRENRE